MLAKNDVLDQEIDAFEVQGGTPIVDHVNKC
jgi:hypothetical protein